MKLLKHFDSSLIMKIPIYSNISKTMRENIARAASSAERTGDYIELEVVYGVEMIEDPGTLTVCYDWAFGFHGNVIEKKNKLSKIDRLLVEDYRKIENDVLNNDLIIYRNSVGNEKVHFDIYEGNGSVISKWDILPVFRHAPFMIPSEYGNMIEIYRLKKCLTLA
jgi:hypothetical protein